MLALLATSAALLAACAPATTAPTPTPTPILASETEAFAAAEEVYRAYNAAGDARRNGESTPSPQDFLIGQALENDIDAVNSLREMGLKLTGRVSVDSFTPVRSTLDETEARLIAVVCLDMSETTVLDENGSDTNPENRPRYVAQQVTFVAVAENLRISLEESTEDAEC